MKRKQVRLTHRTGIPIILSAVLMLALALVSAGHTPAQAAMNLKQNAGLSWRMTTNIGSFSICVGEFQEIQVRILRVGAIGQFISGGRVAGLVEDSDVGELISGQDLIDVIGVPPQAEAIFYFQAKNPGQTTIEFVNIRTGDEGFYGGPTHASEPDPVKVEVTPCYEAYAGAGILNYTKKDICSLERPFKLEGFSAGTEFGVTANQQNKTQLYAFTPIDTQHGNFSLKDRMTVPQVGCTIYINGTYVLQFYDRAKTEGNIVMTGAGTMVCDNGNFSEHPNANPQIGFRALPQGVACSP